MKIKRVLFHATDWCERGHVVLVLAGELITELRDGRRLTLGPGLSSQVADGRCTGRDIAAWARARYCGPSWASR